MSLDMYLYATPDPVGCSVNFEVSEAEELAYWRDREDLHGFMEELYYLKGGSGRFNDAGVVLAPDDLITLEELVRRGLLVGRKQKSGGSRDLATLRQARSLLSQGYTVFYQSWR